VPHFKESAKGVALKRVFFRAIHVAARYVLRPVCG